MECLVNGPHNLDDGTRITTGADEVFDARGSFRAVAGETLL
jgi:hypothetical protein